MRVTMWFIPLIPIGLSVNGFTISMLGLIAGNTPGFMEDYQIIMVSETPTGLAGHRTCMPEC